MDVLTSLQQSTRHVTSAGRGEVPAAASRAAHAGESATLALLRLGCAERASAYLVAADAFALARAHLNEGFSVAPHRNSALAWEAGGADRQAIEAATAQLASALLASLAALSAQEGDPHRILALARAGLAAADGHRVLAPEQRDVGHLR